MKKIFVTDKKGTLIFTIKAYDTKVHNILLKQLKKNKKMNVYERDD